MKHDEDGLTDLGFFTLLLLIAAGIGVAVIGWIQP